MSYAEHVKRKYSFVLKSILIFFLFSLVLLFPSRQYADLPCAGLDVNYSRCVPPGGKLPSPVRDCSSYAWPSPGFPQGIRPDNRCQWLPVYTTGGGKCTGTCYETEDSCYEIITNNNAGKCSSVADNKLLCQGYTEMQNAGGCTGQTPVCYAKLGGNPPTPVNCATSQPTGSVPNPCPNNICNTALGPIDVTNGSTFVRVIFQALLGISGGIALLMIIISGYNMAISQGNPEKIKGAQETLTAAIIGLLFIILSVAILQIIGVDILKLPGFNP